MADLRLVVATSFLENCGGMERVVLKIAQEFDARVHCMYYDREGTFPEFQGLDVESAGFLPKKHLPFGSRMATGIEAGSHFYNLKLKGYDLINAHTTPSEWVRNRNSPVLWYCHSPNREAFDLYDWRMQKRNILSKGAYWASIQAFRHFEFSAVPKIEHIFANSRNTQGRIRKYLKRESEVLHPGVEARKFAFRGFEEFFFYPSRLIAEKDHAFAIEAFRLFSKKFPLFRLIIAGALPKGKEGYLEHLRFLSRGLPVSFEPDISEERLIELYSRCMGVLYSPINEDFGLVPLEAMASRKVCIARDDAGPKETIDGGQDGFLIDSPTQMASRMEWLVKNPGLREKMGNAGRSKVEKKFTWDAFLKKFGQRAKETVEKHNSK